jgi:hypothetical protein
MTAPKTRVDAATRAKTTSIGQWRDEAATEPSTPATTRRAVPGGDRPADAPRTLAREVERHAETEDAVEGRDRAQVKSRRGDDRRIAREEARPFGREDRRGETDEPCGAAGHRRADPGDSQRVAAVARADAASDERDDAGAESEQERNQQVVEAGADPYPAIASVA